VLASAMYEAYLADMKMADILTVLATETSPRGATTLMTAVTPQAFLQVLSEFAALIRDTVPAAPGIRTPDAVKKQARLAESLWVHCLWLIIEVGLLGPDYAPKFRRALLGRSRYAQDIYLRLDEIFAPRRRFSPRRRPKPAELYEAWLAHGLPPEAQASLSASRSPVDPPLPGTPPPAAPPPPGQPAVPGRPSLPSRIFARVRSWFFLKPRFKGEGAHTADHESKQGTPP